MSGYIALWRRLQKHFLWREHRTFSKAEAWIDILMEAQYTDKPREVILGSVILIQNYAECLKSLDTWAGRWNWHKSKVRRFLKLLQRENMIRFTNEIITTRLFVVNYASYDPKRNAVETQLKRKRHGVDTELTPNNKGKKVNNVNNKKNKEEERPQIDPVLFNLKNLPQFSKFIIKSDKWRESLTTWINAYPDVNIEEEIKKSVAWIQSNPKKAPQKDIFKFINGWLGRSKTPPAYQHSQQSSHPLQDEVSRKAGLLTAEEQAEAEGL